MAPFTVTPVTWVFAPASGVVDAGSVLWAEVFEVLEHACVKPARRASAKVNLAIDGWIVFRVICMSAEFCRAPQPLVQFVAGALALTSLVAKAVDWP